MAALNSTANPRIRNAPSSDPAGVATATAAASRNQAATSFNAAEAMAMAPTGRLSIRRSTKMRASTGKAVMDRAAPMNSANGA